MKEDQNTFIMVSIRCLVFNHEKYLRQCLEGFVMQKTNFRFEAIVHDDVSTDKSCEIIREFQHKYPDIIKPVLETENQYSKHDGSLQRIMNSHIHGKYVALCEGDDYWTDPYKLQKQVDFLESHPEYSMCFHNAIQHYETSALKFRGRIKQDTLFSNIIDKDYSGKEVYKKWLIPTASVVCRSNIFTSDIYVNHVQTNNKFIAGDIVLFLTCAHYGKLRGMSDVMSVYRRNLNGAVFTFQNNRLSFWLRYIEHHIEIYTVFGNEYKPISEKARITYAFKLFALSKFKNRFYLTKYFKESPVKTIYYSIYTTGEFLFKAIQQRMH